jgi:acetamidase/formamidase
MWAVWASLLLLDPNLSQYRMQVQITPYAKCHERRSSHQLATGVILTTAVPNRNSDLPQAFPQDHGGTLMHPNFRRGVLIALRTVL